MTSKEISRARELLGDRGATLTATGAEACRLLGAALVEIDRLTAANAPVGPDGRFVGSPEVVAGRLREERDHYRDQVLELRSRASYLEGKVRGQAEAAEILKARIAALEGRLAASLGSER